MTGQGRLLLVDGLTRRTKVGLLDENSRVEEIRRRSTKACCLLARPDHSAFNTQRSSGAESMGQVGGRALFCRHSEFLGALGSLTACFRLHTEDDFSDVSAAYMI